MRVVALFRVSTEKQASEGASLDAQQRRYRELASANGWETVAEFRGHESATQAASDRRVLQQVLSCLRDREVDAVYVHEQSRLTRGDELEVALLMRELKERAIKIIVNGVVRDLASIDERFMVGIQSLVDRAESERIKERLGRGKREKALKGLRTCGPAPYGYRNPPPGSPGRGTLQVVPDEAPVVVKAFELAAQGLGLVRIAAALNGLGFPSRRGVRWGKTAVRRLLQNPAYIGHAVSNAWVAPKGSRNFQWRPDNPRAIVKQGAHQPIVDRAMWEAVNGRAKPPRAARPRMLAGLLQVNGIKMSGDSVAGRALYRGPRGGRGHAWLPAKEADEAVWRAFAALATGEEFVAALMNDAGSARQREVAAAEADYLEDQLAKARKRLDRLLEMRLDGELDKAAFAAKSAETRAVIDRLERELREQRGKAAALDGSHAARVVRAVRVLLNGAAVLTTEQQRAVLRSIVTRVDATAERRAGDFARDARGRVVPGRAVTWAITGVSFRLALPPAADAPRANVGGQAGSEPTREGEGAARSCDQAPATETVDRAGDLVTTL